MSPDRSVTDAAAEEQYLTAEHGDSIKHDMWSLAQRGLVYPAPHALFATFWRSDGPPITKAILKGLLQDVRKEIHERYGSANTSTIAGVGLHLWMQWCQEEGVEPPRGMHLLYPADDEPYRSAVFQRASGTYADSQADLWFHVKSDEHAHCAGVFELIRTRLEKEGCVDPARTVHQRADTKAPPPDYRNGKVLGCRFSETLNNPTSPVEVQTSAVVGFEDPDHLGASFVLAQRFRIHWDLVLNMSDDQIEDLVGRTTQDVIIPTLDTRGHIHCARVQDARGNTMQILRLSLPFGTSPAIESDDLRLKGATVRDEEGLYFAGFAKDAKVLEAIVASQIGDDEGALRDRLLANMHSDLGGLYYVPSLPDLGLDPVDVPALEDADWGRFPGVDWNRLDRHFDQRSSNGLMHYNHKDYLFHMGTMSGEERERYGPPTYRVLQLLAVAFSRWQDNWYFDRSQQELNHLSYYLERSLGAAKAAEIMAQPVAVRMGWAAKVSVGEVFVSHEYGYRGRRQDAEGNWINGADTYRLHPAELIVGGLPNLGLGQGRYVMDYQRDDERVDSFFASVTFASGVGHVVPMFERALDAGIGGMIDDVKARRDAAPDDAKRDFYDGVLLALEGVSDHCLAWARLADETAAELPEGRAAERANLAGVAERMRKLATDAPETMLEAAQLIFTLHSCLHLLGEPTAVGRMDRMLHPFYERDRAAGRLTDDEAQEIVDCLWVKFGEKVQLNRQFVEDHQPFGNLAMGGAAGPYPQGGANNQWIQQVTVGGTDPATGSPYYNEITTFCLRAARRLPLNAPCLSLRVRADTPREYLEEAALALLSGGAHPILLNDDKIIPGLVASGDDIGRGSEETAYTPVSEKAGGKWRSEVSIEHARDYACDGCYEPQFVGREWFTLGGMPTLLPLECALNQGKTYASAGPMWFRGTRASIATPHPKDIESFDEVVELFFTHLRLLYSKQVDGMIGGFGHMGAICPSPLLSSFVEGCLEKGLDIYDGGATYNVIAPCFTAPSTTINSLYAIKKMVFDPDTAVTSLPELVEALICDWGNKMVEPFVSTLAGPARIEARAERFRRLREIALAQPRYGRGHPEIDELGNTIVRRIAETAVTIFTDPVPSTAQKMLANAERIGTVEQPFGGFQIQPGVGTFENYLEFGAQWGASADGRRLGDPMASDLSPSPMPSDLPPEHQPADLVEVLAGYTGSGTDALWDGAPTDLNIREDFPLDDLVRGLEMFAKGAGSNVLTITCADPETFAGAESDPEKYDVVRVRMGGWSEFFVAMFPGHQEQHRRRPLNTPGHPSEVHAP